MGKNRLDNAPYKIKYQKIERYVNIREHESFPHTKSKQDTTIKL